MRYRVRKAAGIFWLIDTKRTPLEFRKPVAMNETGYQMWLRFCENKDEKSTAGELAQIYNISVDDIYEDVLAFKKRLLENGIEFDQNI